MERETISKVPQQATLIFDGHCGVRTRYVRMIKTFDRKQRVTAVPYQMPGVPASARTDPCDRRLLSVMTPVACLGVSHALTLILPTTRRGDGAIFRSR